MKFTLDISDALKADEILAEDAAIRAVNEARKLEGQVKVPVTMRGVLVGYATVLKDGTISAEVDASPAGQELRNLLVDGTVNCISLGPNPNAPVIEPIKIKGL